MEDFLEDKAMKIVIRDRECSWKQVISEVLQGTVLASIMFAVYIIDMIEGVDSYINMFADDAKILHRIQTKEDQDLLQENLDTIWRWN